MVLESINRTLEIIKDMREVSTQVVVLVEGQKVKRSEGQMTR